jgi:negative regulator of flagellin synthesis FlgM
MSNDVTGIQGKVQGNTSQVSPQEQQVDRGLREKPVQEQETGNDTRGDTVTLTDTAARLRNLQETLATLPVVDSGRVESLQRAIANGSFEIDTQRVAEKLFTFEFDLQR